MLERVNPVVPVLMIGQTFIPMHNIVRATLAGSAWQFITTSQAEPRITLQNSGPDAWMMGAVLTHFWNQTRWAANVFTKAEKESILTDKKARAISANAIK